MYIYLKRSISSKFYILHPEHDLLNPIKNGNKGLCHIWKWSQRDRMTGVKLGALRYKLIEKFGPAI